MASVVFAAEKISVIPPWCHAVSSTHVCYYFCLLCTSEAAQPAIGRLWSQPHGAPSVSEAWHCTPALQRQTKTRRSIVTIQEEDRRQNTGMSTPSDLSLSGPPLTPGRGPRTPPPPTRRTETADVMCARRVWQPSCFHSFFISVWCSCSNCCQIFACQKMTSFRARRNSKCGPKRV